MAIDSPTGNSQSITALIAARVAAAGKTLADPVAPAPRANVMQVGVTPASPKAITFIGPSGACIWFNGHKSTKRFSSNGVYVTDDEFEAKQLRTMQQVTELSPELVSQVVYNG